MELTDEVKQHRTPEHEVFPLFVNRWSPRSMTGEKLDAGTLPSLFEAARWAPSSNNGQPWRFFYAERESEHWDLFFSFLFEGNQSWCEQAGALIVVLSRTAFEYKEKPYRTHAFDTGAAWQNIALEGTNRGLVVHAMGGVDLDKIRTGLNVPDKYEIICMIAVGKRGVVDALPEQLREREIPSGRKPVSEIAFEGKYEKKEDK